MAGQVLEISKQFHSATTPQPQHPPRPARVYHFPAPKAAVSVATPAPALPAPRKSHLRTHLLLELSIGILLWVVWFVWHLLH